MNTGMEIRVVLDGEIPVYRQIADGIRAYCVDGRLEPGMKLPSVRQMAASLGVHHNTVAQAYRLLEDERWIWIPNRRQGAIVQERMTPEQPDAREQVAQGSRLRQMLADVRAKGFSREWILKEVMAALEAQS